MKSWSWGAFKQAKVVQVIWSTERRGAGIEDDPVRIVFYLHALDGSLVLALDPITDETYASSEALSRVGMQP